MHDHGIMYTCSSIPQLRQTRATKRDATQLWPDRKVYYAFDSTVNSSLKDTIQLGMNTIQRLTCVQFIPRNGERDYVLFRSRPDDGCSSHVGRAGGMQTIKIGPRCNRQHTIIHEMCHSLAVWHEQSRPDRDNYLKILTNNIEKGKEHDFFKRTPFEVDSQGVSYDYASVMHYRLDSFNTRDPLHTLEVTNQQEYERQGSPDLGRVPTMSKSDVTQINRLYNCPGTGVAGDLTLRILRAQNIPSVDDPYVRVTAYDDKGQSQTMTTAYFNNTANPVWNTNLVFGRRNNWQYINVSIWDHDTPPNRDDLLTRFETFSINSGRYELNHCNDVNCRENMSFVMTLKETCKCYNKGLCLSGTKCTCANGYGGPNCQYVRGKLRISVSNANNLVNSDNDGTASDPYVVVQAYDHNGAITIQRTKVISNNQNPVWNEDLSFLNDQENEWSWFTLQVFDSDQQSSSDRLSYANTYVLDSTNRQITQTQEAIRGGTVMFSYSLVSDVNIAPGQSVTDSLNYGCTLSPQVALYAFFNILLLVIYL